MEQLVRVSVGGKVDPIGDIYRDRERDLIGGEKNGVLVEEDVGGWWTRNITGTV